MKLNSTLDRNKLVCETGTVAPANLMKIDSKVETELSLILKSNRAEIDFNSISIVCLLKGLPAVKLMNSSKVFFSPQVRLSPCVQPIPLCPNKSD